MFEIEDIDSIDRDPEEEPLTPPPEWTEAGLTDEQFDAVDQAGDGVLSRSDVRDAIDQWLNSTDGEVNSVAFTREDIRNVVDVFINT